MDRVWFIGGLTALALAPLAAFLYAAGVDPDEEPSGAVGAASPVRTAASLPGFTFAPPAEAEPGDGPPSSRRGTFAFAPLRPADHRLGGLSLPGAIDYRDPAGGGAVPLTAVAGREDVPVSKHFRMGDFAANDGAPFARIGPELVELLERLHERLQQPVHVSSAYRHPALNFREGVDGAVESRHMAGLAADVWVEGATPLEVAEAALDVQGCGIGLGLGANFLHVDVRDFPASWVRPGAALPEADFDLWMLERCADSFGEEARLAVEAAPCSKPASGLQTAESFRAELTETAGLHRGREQPGAVLLDVRRHVAGADSDSLPRLAYLPGDSPLLRAMRLEEIARRAEQNENFVFVVVEPDGSHRMGLMRYDGESAAAQDAPAEPAASCE